MKPSPLRVLCLSSAICAALAPAASAVAQQRFTLTEDDEWTEVHTPDPAEPEGQLAEARAALAGGEHARAINLANRWIDRHPRHQLLPEAMLVRADALMARDEVYKALFDYEYIARMYPGSEAFVIALERELDIAKRFARGERRRLWGLKIVNATDDAEELLIRIQERLPGSRLAEDAGMELADFYFRQPLGWLDLGRPNMVLAAEAYDLFIENYPDSEQISKARRRLIYAHLASFKGPQYDAAGLYEAKLRLQELRIVEPYTAEQVGAEALLVRIDESDAMKLLENARWYWRTGDAVAAELTIRRLVQTYPGTVASAEALQLVEAILPRLPQSSRDAAPDYEAIRQGTGAQP